MSQNAYASALVYVGIGASAGGLKALRDLLPGLPVGSGYCYVVLQHMDPRYPSALDQILRRDTRLRVEIATNDCHLKPEHLYIAPSDQDCTVVDGVLHLKPAHAGGPRHSVDLLFTTLAEAHRQASVGIILSGTGTDGLQGVRAIKAAEGIVLVQDPADAEHQGMPAAVLQARLTDIVGPASALGAELQRVIERTQQATPALHQPSATDERAAILRLLLRKTGFSFDHYKDTTIDRRIRRRMDVGRLDTLAEYLRVLEASDTEADLLLKDMQISVTGFFRGEQAFTAAARVIQQLVNQKPNGNPVRIWVPGCATGEEAFSLAILVAEAFGSRLATANIQIFGTDIDTDAIAHARKSTYWKSLVEPSVSPALIDKYFDAVDQGYKVRPIIRDLVVFAEHNILQDPPFSHLDLVSCRNLLIYFKRSAQQRLLRALHYVLNPGGHLFLGPAEGIGNLNSFFEPIQDDSSLFIRQHVDLPPPSFAHLARGKRLQAPVKEPLGHQSIDQQVQTALLEQYTPPAVLVDANFDIVHVRGDLSPFARLPEGAATINALDFAVPELRLELRLLLHKAQRAHGTARSRSIEMKIGAVDQLVTLVAFPVNLHPPTQPHTLVLFETQLSVTQSTRADTTEQTANFQIRELEQQLTATRDHLQSNIGEIEASNQELQLVNEEFQSTTEELQSTNEEFQTANEELQSTNEELRTVNDELQRKSAELETANRELEGILNAIVEGIIVLDSELKVTRYSARSKEVLDLLPTNIGRPLMAVAGPVDLTLLSAEMQTAFNEQRTTEHELELDDRVFQVRLIPQPTGLIIAFSNETEKIRSDRQSRRLATVVRDSNDAITVQDPNGNILAWNNGAEKLYGYLESEALTMNISELLPPAYAEDAAAFLKGVLADDPRASFETVRLTKDRRELAVWVTATALRDERGVAYEIATTERDLAARRVTDAARRAAINESDVLKRFQTLTPRERQIMGMLVAGSSDHSSREIASELGISARTVDTHRQHIKDKMAAKSISDLTLKARLCGL